MSANKGAINAPFFLRNIDLFSGVTMSPDCGVSDSFECWGKVLQTVCGPFVSSPLRRHDLFIGEVHRQDFDGLSVAHVRTNAALITRQSPSIDRDDDRFFSCYSSAVAKNASVNTITLLS